MSSETPRLSLARLTVTLPLSLALLCAGGALTAAGFGPWYDGLALPPFQPPGWVFSPAWTILLTALALATSRVARQEPSAWRSWALRLYLIQLPLNVGWSLLFFALHQPPAALVEILLLDLVLAGMVVSYAAVDRVAGLLIAPYLAWLGFATAINAWIVMHNPA